MANSSVLMLVQSFCREYGLPVPTALQGSTDAGALQMRELLRSVGDDIWDYTNWQQCQRRASWVSTPGPKSLSSITGGFSHMIGETFWDMTQKIPITGPLSDIDWQARAALAAPGPIYSFRFAQDNIEFVPAIPTGHTLEFLYKSRFWINASGGPTDVYSEDSNTAIFSNALMKAGLIAYWLRVKQMPHRLEMDKYENLKTNEAGKNGVRAVLRMDNEGHSRHAGIVIPIGNWPI